MLASDSARFVITDSSGHFQFDGVAPGRYILRSVHIGYKLLTDTIVVPLNGRELEIVLHPLPSDPFLCVFERELAAEPALTLIRPETVTLERSFPDGARLQHRVIAHATPTELIFDSRIKNIGRVPAVVTILCRSWAESSVLRHLIQVGPACYGHYLTIVPGDTLLGVTGGSPRGQPGRYPFLVHVVDPAALDAKFPLDLVFAKRP
jgi:hypothetical protein